MKATIICPKCGKTNDQVPFVDAFCSNCYPTNIKTPEDEKIDRCKRCGRMLFKGEWAQYDEKKIAKHIISKCRGEFSSAEYDFQNQLVEFKLKKGNDETIVRRPVPLTINTVMCQQCSRISGGYFEAIIQLRGDNKKVEKLTKLFVKRLEGKTFISKTEETEIGVDLYVGSSKTVLSVVTALGAKALITRKLIGRDQGKRLYRTTFAIRL